jgi:hypothetical protein
MNDMCELGGRPIYIYQPQCRTIKFELKIILIGKGVMETHRLEQGYSSFVPAKRKVATEVPEHRSASLIVQTLFDSSAEALVPVVAISNVTV